MKDDKLIGKGSALQIIYYLMAVDGEICKAEEEMFDSIGNEMLESRPARVFLPLRCDS